METLCSSTGLFVIRPLIYLSTKHEKNTCSVLGPGGGTVNDKDTGTPLRYFNSSGGRELVSGQDGPVRGWGASQCTRWVREAAWGSACGLETLDQGPARGEGRSPETLRTSV